MTITVTPETAATREALTFNRVHLHNFELKINPITNETFFALEVQMSAIDSTGTIHFDGPKRSFYSKDVSTDILAHPYAASLGAEYATMETSIGKLVDLIFPEISVQE